MTPNEKFGGLCPALRKQVTDKVFCPIETPMGVRKIRLGLTEELRGCDQGEGTFVTDKTHSFSDKSTKLSGEVQPYHLIDMCSIMK